MFAIMAVGTEAVAQTEPPGWEPITQERLLNPEDGDWLSYRRTYDVFGFSPLDQINRTNVQDLRPVWAYSMLDNSRWVPTPIVANGLMYVAEGSGRVVAFDVVSGDVAWIHERDYPEDIRSSQAFGRHRESPYTTTRSTGGRLTLIWSPWTRARGNRSGRSGREITIRA